jgi:hypothetical protein
MSLHNVPLTEIEESGLKAHGLDIGVPSQLSDAFRLGIAWAFRVESNAEKEILQDELQYAKDTKDLDAYLEIKDKLDRLERRLEDEQ